MGTQPLWHFLSKLTSWSFASFSMVFLLFGTNFLVGHFVITQFFLGKVLLPCPFIVFSIFCFDKSFYTRISIVLKFSLGEIAMDGDSTTVALFVKNNFLVVRFILNGVSFVWNQLLGREFCNYAVFSRKSTLSMPIHRLFYFLF